MEIKNALKAALKRRLALLIIFLPFLHWNHAAARCPNEVIGILGGASVLFKHPRTGHTGQRAWLEGNALRIEKKL